METKKTAFSVAFWVRKTKSKVSEVLIEVPIYARVTIDGRRMDQSTKQKIIAEDWNQKRGMAKLIKEEYKALNSYLEQLRASYAECYRQMFLAKKVINIDTFKRAYLGMDDDEFTLCQLINYHNQDMKDSICWGTLKNYFTTQKYLEKYLKEKIRVADIGLKEINHKFVTGFEYFLKSFKPVDHHKPLGNNGVMKHMERFRKMINVALKNDWMEKDPFKAYKPKFTKYERGFLTEDELQTIEQKEFTIERLQFVKDLFIFSCYTGLAYADTISLTPANLILGIDRDYWLITQRQKTSTSVKIPLLPKAMEMIEKYKTSPKSVADGSLFPKISNQRLNGYLKEMADLCGINKNLTFHLARHTFATTVTLSNGVPIESVSKMLGHTKITTTQVYAKVIERKLSDDMQLLKGKLLGKNNNDGRRSRDA